ncbi:putative multidrug resistance protein EmrY [bacterium BMS3Bbin10]|nr:putative multidrug resistance protein EmrY [bacterium BMS3Bbin10]
MSALAEAGALPSGFRLKLITIALILAPLIQVFDTALLSIALRQMQGSLSATQDQMAWVLTSYLIALAVMTPFWGAISSIFGRKPLLLLSIVGFVTFSMLSGTSDTLREILIYRFFQGAFGAALIPLSQSALLSIYPREDFGIAMGWWGVGIMFGPVFGPTLGGYLTEYFNWRWVFYLNLPLGLLAFAMIAALVPRQRNTTRRAFNYLGFIMLAITVASVQFVLDRGERLDWFSSPAIIVLCLAAAGAFWVFTVNSATSRTPFVDPAIFRDRNYVFGIVLRILFGVFLFSSLVLVPPFLQNQGGYPLIDSGIIMASRGVGAMIAAMFTGRMLKFIDPRKVILAGMMLSAYSMWEFSNFTQDIDLTVVLINNFAQGIALSFFIIPVNTVAFSSIAPEQRDVGTAFYSLLNNIGRSLGIALFASYLARNTQAVHEILRADITPFNDALRHVGVPEVWNLDTLAGLQAVNAMVSAQAELIAYIIDFRLLAAIIVICMPVVFLLRNPLKAEPAR